MRYRVQKLRAVFSEQFVSILKVLFSNITALLNGVITGFAVPKILSMEGYGYSKVFTLYATYLGICHLGIIDGIVFLYGGKDYNMLPKREMRWYWKWYLLINGSGAFLLIVMSWFIANRNSRFLLAALAIELVTVNTITYFQQISQITQRFDEYAKRKVLYCLITTIFTLGLWIAYQLGRQIQYQFYIVLHLAVNLIFSAWYLFSYREIVFGTTDKLLYNTSRIAQILICGFPLLIANMCSTLLLILDRQFVNILFETRTYAIYAFAYNLLALITAATSAVSTVLYPFLKRSAIETSWKMFPQMTYASLTLMLAACAVFFPLRLIIHRFLPQYQKSLDFLRILFPGMALTSCVTVIFQNFEKAEGQYRRYFTKSVMALLVATLLNVVAYAIFKSPEAISVASVLAALFWYYDVAYALSKSHPIQLWPTIFYSAVATGLFYWTSMITNNLIGCVLFSVSFMFESIVFYKKFSSRRIVKEKCG